MARVMKRPECVRRKSRGADEVAHDPWKHPEGWRGQ
jgi:hypothetical protein